MSSSSDRPLHGRLALVVGGARGIGAAIAAALARDGADVAVVYRRSGAEAAALAAHVESLGRRLVAVQVDVREEAAFRTSLGALLDRAGAVDILVYSAGIANAMPVLGGELDRMREVFDVNFWPAVLATQLVLPHMLVRRFGRLVFVSSVTAERGSIQGQAAYAASKAALNALTRTLAAEVSSRGDLTANAVAPGPVRTELTSRAFDAAGDAVLESTPAGRYGEPWEIAEMVTFLASERAAYVTGQVLYVDGGFGNKYVSLRKRRRPEP